jgi:hypothetical protein
MRSKSRLNVHTYSESRAGQLSPVALSRVKSSDLDSRLVLFLFELAYSVVPIKNNFGDQT